MYIIEVFTALYERHSPCDNCIQNMDVPTTRGYGEGTGHAAGMQPGVVGSLNAGRGADFR